jgi:hypothetical protein
MGGKHHLRGGRHGSGRSRQPLDGSHPCSGRSARRRCSKLDSDNPGTERSPSIWSFAVSGIACDAYAESSTGLVERLLVEKSNNASSLTRWRSVLFCLLLAGCATAKAPVKVHHRHHVTGKKENPSIDHSSDISEVSPSPSPSPSPVVLEEPTLFPGKGAPGNRGPQASPDPVHHAHQKTEEEKFRDGELQ